MLNRIQEKIEKNRYKNVEMFRRELKSIVIKEMGILDMKNTMID